MKYCSECGGNVTLEVPAGDDRRRFVCSVCGTVHYQNPKLVVGTIPQQNGRILLCRRSIEPQKDKWTLPAGYHENNETLVQGAVRETLEEARARVQIIAPYRLFDLPFISQVYLMFRADLMNSDFGSTAESSEVRLFAQDAIPWDDIAFQVIAETLTHFFHDRRRGRYEFQLHELSQTAG